MQEIHVNWKSEEWGTGRCSRGGDFIQFSPTHVRVFSKKSGTVTERELSVPIPWYIETVVEVGTDGCFVLPALHGFYFIDTRTGYTQSYALSSEEKEKEIVLTMIVGRDLGKQDLEQIKIQELYTCWSSSFIGLVVSHGVLITCHLDSKFVDAPSFDVGGESADRESSCDSVTWHTLESFPPRIEINTEGTWLQTIVKTGSSATVSAPYLQLLRSDTREILDEHGLDFSFHQRIWKNRLKPSPVPYVVPSKDRHEIHCCNGGNIASSLCFVTLRRVTSPERTELQLWTIDPEKKKLAPWGKKKVLAFAVQDISFSTRGWFYVAFTHPEWKHHHRSIMKWEALRKCRESVNCDGSIVQFMKKEFDAPLKKKKKSVGFKWKDAPVFCLFYIRDLLNLVCDYLYSDGLEMEDIRSMILAEEKEKQGKKNKREIPPEERRKKRRM